MADPASIWQEGWDACVEALGGVDTSHLTDTNPYKDRAQQLHDASVLKLKARKETLIGDLNKAAILFVKSALIHMTLGDTKEATGLLKESLEAAGDKSVALLEEGRKAERADLLPIFDRAWPETKGDGYDGPAAPLVETLLIEREEARAGTSQLLKRALKAEKALAASNERTSLLEDEICALGALIDEIDMVGSGDAGPDQCTWGCAAPREPHTDTCPVNMAIRDRPAAALRRLVERIHCALVKAQTGHEHTPVVEDGYLYEAVLRELGALE